MKHLSVIAIGALLVCSASASAEPARSDKADMGDQSRVICRTQQDTGSRLNKARVCRTAAEWAEMKRSERQAIERVQADRYKNE